MFKRYNDPDGSITLLCADCEDAVVTAWPVSSSTYGADYAGKYYEGSKADVESLIEKAQCAECLAEAL
jgi:hypothetical protein